MHKRAKSHNNLYSGWTIVSMRLIVKWPKNLIYRNIKLDALRAFVRPSYHSIKSYFTKTHIGRNKSKLKNQDILVQEFRLDIYN